MLVTMAEILNRAREGGYGVAAPNIQSENTIRAVIEVAEEMNAPMIIDVNHFIFEGRARYFGPMICEFAKDAKVPIAINLDHGGSYEEIMFALQAGFSSVMADRSTLSYEDNVKEVSEIVKMAHALGVSVEAELGHVGSGSNYAVDGKQFLTDPDEARRFVEDTGVDCLAVAIGSAHGAYKGTPYLDFERLEAIVKAIPKTPLVLHGGSGTGDENLAKATRSGINKVNLCTDLFTAGKVKLLDTLNENPGLGVYNLLPTFLSGYKDMLAHYVKLFDQAGRA
ncbi:MAG: class II fructose-bisphosphate aldolase [Clostridiales bacterium]|nr:class II fructose-bisphosphate aldolase [Clostridiales bacterium]